MRLHGLTLAVVLLALVTGCAGTVTRPAPEPAADTRAVFLLDHGRHSSLVLTRSDDTMIRYLYGDWRWYARQQTGLLRAFPTLFCPTRATLGRRELEGPPQPQSIQRQIPVVIRQIHTLQAEVERIDALDNRLDARFEQGIDTLHYNSTYDLDFVHDPRDYTVFYNSNHVVADWLRELGIEVRGNPIWGWWRVE